MSDPLADVIRTARVERYFMADPPNMIDRRIAAAVRARLASVLDAEMAEWDANKGWEQDNVPFVLDRIRAALGLFAGEPVPSEGEAQ